MGDQTTFQYLSFKPSLNPPPDWLDTVFKSEPFNLACKEKNPRVMHRNIVHSFSYCSSKPAILSNNFEQIIT